MSALRKNDDDTIYEALIKRFPLRPIRTDEQNERAAEMCDELTDRLDKLTPAENDYLEVLSDLISKYESRWEDECSAMSPADLVRYLMEVNGLEQQDLVPEFGSNSDVSEFLDGRRQLSIEQARSLSERFKIKISAFIPNND